MIPIVPRKSSTGIPLSTWTFLKTCSARRGFSCDADCAAAKPTPISPTTAISVAASITRPDHVCPLNDVIVVSPFVGKWESRVVIIVPSSTDTSLSLLLGMLERDFKLASVSSDFPPISCGGACFD